MVRRFILFAWLLTPTPLLAAPPALTHLFPAGGQRGTKVTITATGNFSWPVQVWAPGVEVVPAKESGTLEVSIPKDLAADRVWIRLYNAEGASIAAPFLIGALPETLEKEPNDQPRDAQKLEDPNVTINGVLGKAGDVDCFAVSLNAGQTLVASVDAHGRLGSPMDAILQVTTPDGAVLAENNDDVHLDPRLVFIAKAAGMYVVRLFAFPATADSSIRFSGGPNYIYRLTLTTGPFITHAVPLSAPSSQPGEIEVLGWNLPAKSKFPVVPYGGVKFAGQHECEAPNELRLPGDARWGFVLTPNFAGSARVRLTGQAVLSAIEPADPKEPRLLALGTSATGLLRARRQVDAYRVPLKKGQQVVVSCEANTIGFPLDPVVTLLDPDGKVAAEVDDTGEFRDAAFTHGAAKDGDYRIQVRDRYRQGGERCYYRLTVRPEEPDFELISAMDNLVVTPGKATDLVVKVQRRGGGVGPITVQPLELPPGVTAPAAVSEPTGPTTAAVTLKFSATGPAYSGPLRIGGKVGQPKVMEHFVRTAPRLGAAFESLWLTVADKK